MARKLSKREVGLLSFLTVAAVSYLVYVWLQQGSIGRRVDGTAEEKKTAVSKEPPPVVRMDLLARPVDPYDGSGRDLFQYSQRPPSAEEIRRLKEEAERRRKEAEEAAKRAAIDAAERQKQQEVAAREAVLHPPPPQPPAINLRYLGVIGPKDDKIVVFEDAGQLLLARRGEVVKDQFRIVDVKWQSVIMGFVRPEFKGQTRELTMAVK
jgi:hypothetical protein